MGIRTGLKDEQITSGVQSWLITVVVSAPEHDISGRVMQNLRDSERITVALATCANGMSLSGADLRLYDGVTMLER